MNESIKDSKRYELERVGRKEKEQQQYNLLAQASLQYELIASIQHANQSTMNIESILRPHKPMKPLIILLPISEYFNNFAALPGIKYDTIANRRFWSSLGYEIFPSRNDNRWYGKMFWTKTEIIQYFDNIIDTKLLDKNRKLIENGFDAIIIIISCHGGQIDIIYSSDEKPINLSNIYNQFGSGKYIKNNYALIKIPRIFIVDACRGSYIAQTVTFSTNNTNNHMNNMNPYSQNISMTNYKAMRNTGNNVNNVNHRFCMVPTRILDASNVKKNNSKNVQKKKRKEM